MNKEIKCCLCDEIVSHETDSHNPYPVAKGEKDRCCSICNVQKVIPARIVEMYK
jgi:hypothetical protein|tara:strand:- start:1597 stop:1758 length:162 start_codon:yes stop_codon:yes gene_type:complete